MWMRLAALAAFAFVPCAHAQGTVTPAPLTLDDALARVAQHHPDLLLVDAQRPLWEARGDAAGLRPPLTVGMGLENALGTGGNRSFKAAQLTVTLAGVLERVGKLDARRAVVLANIDNLAPQREIARLDLMAEVARRYLAVTDARQQLSLAETDIEQRKRAVAAARLRLQAGASPESVLMTAQAMLAQAELDRDRAHQMDQSARGALSALWRQREPGFDVVTGDPMQMPALQDFAVLADELQRTPELAVLAGERRIREAQVKLARTQARPDFSWQVGVRNSRDTRDTSLVAGFSVPLGSVRRADPEIRAAEAELALNSVERDARALQLYATLAEAHGRYLTSRLEVTRMGRDVLPQLKRAENAAEKAWRAGAISYMEWAQLQAMRIDAGQRQLQVAVAAQIALIEIQRLSGQSMLAATDGRTVLAEDRP